jgi:hypothetical protein
LGNEGKLWFWPLEPGENQLDIIFRNGLVVSDGIEQNVDLAIKDGVVKALGDLEGVEAARVIDCSGKYLLPGAVDLGVNLLGDGEFDPPSRSSFALATREALRGGVTTVITNLELGEEDSAPDEIAKQSEIDASSSYVDFGYHLAIQNWNENRAVQTRQSLNMGVCSFWVGRTGLSTPWPAPALLHAVTDHLPENALVITTPYEAVLSRYFLQKAKAIGPIEDQNWTALCPESFEAGLPYRPCGKRGKNAVVYMVRWIFPTFILTTNKGHPGSGRLYVANRINKPCLRPWRMESPVLLSACTGLAQCPRHWGTPRKERCLLLVRLPWVFSIQPCTAREWQNGVFL